MISKQAIKLFKSLNIPKYDDLGNSIFNPVTDLPCFGDWNVYLSERSRGKTTNLLLLGMCCFYTDGIQIQYIRQYDDMLTPSKLNSLFDVIIDNKYIEKMTDGEFNSVKYYRREWFFVHINEHQEIDAECETPFCHCLGINKESSYRSTYNAPHGDFIIFDEFMRTDKLYMSDEFVLFNNILSTIIRKRTTAQIFMLGNMVDISNPHLLEMGILDIVRKMPRGDFKKIDADGTLICIKSISMDNIHDKQFSISKYFPWKTAKMVGITGAGGKWALKMYPHAPRDDFQIVDKAQIECDEGLICREIRAYKNGLYVMFYPLYKPLENRVSYTLNDELPFNTMRRYGLGYTDTDKYVYKLIKIKHVYFSDNVTGDRVYTYLKNIKK